VKRPVRFSEAIKTGLGPGIIVQCDSCGEWIDYVAGSFWVGKVRKGTLYSSKRSNRCHKCIARGKADGGDGGEDAEVQSTVHDRGVPT